MWKELWRKWTIDKPAVLGDWLWEFLLAPLAAFLARLTLRKIVALIPLGVILVAYYHSVPVPPELMLLGDVLAYIDIFSVLFLLGILSRAAPILFVMRQMAARLKDLASATIGKARRLHFRSRREPRAPGAKRPARPENDDEPVPGVGFAWAWCPDGRPQTTAGRLHRGMMRA